MEVDIAVDYSQKHTLKDVLVSELPGHLELIENYRQGNFKICRRNASAIDKRHYWSFPFIDIMFFKTDSKYIWEESSLFLIGRFLKAKNIFESHTIFPLIRRPFLNLWMWCPRDASAYLRAMYKNITCHTHEYSHRFETRIPVQGFDCFSLHKTYPFAIIVETKNGQQHELLTLDGKIIQWIVVNCAPGDCVE